MTALPRTPGGLLTVADFAALPEDEGHRWELLEGNLLMSPSPRPRHMAASARFDRQLAPQLPSQLESVPDVDVDLALSPADQPGTVRLPDLVVVRRSALARVEADGTLLRASDVVIVVEIVSPGSQRMDTVVKRGEYSDAGIPYYWIINLDRPVSLLACHLAGAFGYEDSGELTGRYDSTDPFPISIDLESLVASA